MSGRRRRPKLGEAHVRLYAHELNAPAYRHLSTDARALLVEFKALFNGGANRIFMSVREAMQRLNVGQRRSQHAREELLACGWIIELEKGAFSCKTKMATIYALGSEPLSDADGATPPKDYMRWQPSAKKITVAATATDGSQDGYRDLVMPPRRHFSSRHSYRNPPKRPVTVAATATQIELPRRLTSRRASSTRNQMSVVSTGE